MHRADPAGVSATDVCCCPSASITPPKQLKERLRTGSVWVTTNLNKLADEQLCDRGGRPMPSASPFFTLTGNRACETRLVRGDPQNEGLRRLQPRALGSELDYFHAGITSTRLHRPGPSQIKMYGFCRLFRAMPWLWETRTLKMPLKLARVQVVMFVGNLQDEYFQSPMEQHRSERLPEQRTELSENVTAQLKKNLPCSQVFLVTFTKFPKFLFRWRKAKFKPKHSCICEVQ